MPSLVQSLAWGFAPTWLMDRCARTLGDAFTLTFWPSGLRFAMFSDPEAVKTVFTAPPEVAPSGAAMSPIAAVLGASSVLILTGPEHMRQRKLLLPPFHGERMREYEDVMEQATRRDMAGWELGRPMSLQHHTRSITLEVILRAVFGVEGERTGPLRAAITDMFEPSLVPMVLRALTGRRTAARPTGAIGRALDRLDALIYQEITHRRAQGDVAERADILSLLLGARDEDGEAMTDTELRDELVTLLLAGHETTSTSVAWAVERLVRHPQQLSRLLAEIDAGEADEYLTAVVHETLRVRPVVPIVVRVLERELEVDGYRLPVGTRVAPSIYLTNRNPRVYDSPREFRPERFLGERGGRDINSFSWIPFGGGIRRCIGASFALLEMKVLLRTMLAELEPHAVAGGGWRERLLHGGRGGGEADERVHRRAVTLVPSRGAQVMWRRRSPGRTTG